MSTRTEPEEPTLAARADTNRQPTVHRLTEPASGEVVRLPAGSHLSLCFRRRGLTTQWHVEDVPGNLLPLAPGGHEFAFLVFGAPASSPARLRLVRSAPGSASPAEVRELTVVTSG